MNNFKKIIDCLMVTALLLTSLTMTACGRSADKTKEFKTLEDLSDCTFAISDGNTSYEANVSQELPNVSFSRYTNYFDTFIAVANGNADTAFVFKYTFIGLKQTYPNFSYIESNIDIPIVANFSNSSDAIKSDFNAFIAESRANGVLDLLAQKWMYGYDDLTEQDIVDFSDLNGNKGVIRFALCNDNIPYEYLRNGKLTGFEPAIFHEFCKAYGYTAEITESLFDAVVTGLASGKYDMAMSGYGYTEERSENSHFSDPYFYDKVVYVINEGETNLSFWENLSNAFERTFVKESRWKMFVNGMLVTLLITVLSVLLGSLVGFILFLLSQKSKSLTKLSLGINDTLEALPILVVLLVFFYVIFGKSSVSGVIVSLIVFGLNFAFSFFAMLNHSAGNVPISQKEAGLALGYTNMQTLFKIVLPQAMEFFIPSLRSAIIATLKSTAIVGYVAVQDLTKSGDLIRSQTFEAFLPIISVAILYFLMAKVLIFFLGRLLVTPSEKRIMEREGR